MQVIILVVLVCLNMRFYENYNNIGEFINYLNTFSYSPTFSKKLAKYKISFKCFELFVRYAKFI